MPDYEPIADFASTAFQRFGREVLGSLWASELHTENYGCGTRYVAKCADQDVYTTVNLIRDFHIGRGGGVTKTEAPKGLIRKLEIVWQSRSRDPVPVLVLNLGLNQEDLKLDDVTAQLASGRMVTHGVLKVLSEQPSDSRYVSDALREAYGTERVKVRTKSETRRVTVYLPNSDSKQGLGAMYFRLPHPNFASPQRSHLRTISATASETLADLAKIAKRL